MVVLSVLCDNAGDVLSAVMVGQTIGEVRVGSVDADEDRVACWACFSTSIGLGSLFGLNVKLSRRCSTVGVRELFRSTVG